MSYGKVHDAYWGGDKITPLSDRACLLGLYLITGPHRNAIGCFRLGLGALTDDDRFAKWGIEGVSQALSEMVRTGFIIRDDKTGWTFITNVFKHDPIKGDKACIHAARLASLVPVASQVYAALHAALLPEIKREMETAEAKKRPFTIPEGWPLRDPTYALSEGGSKPLTEPPRSPSPSPSPLPEPSPEPQPARGDTPSQAPPASADHPGAAALPKRAILDPKEEGRLRMEIGNRILEICNVNGAIWTGSFSLISAWLNAGYDVELDIIPTVEAIAKRKGFTFRTLDYFTRPIEEAFQKRCTDIPAEYRRPASTAKLTTAQETAFRRDLKRWIDKPSTERQAEPKPKPEDYAPDGTRITAQGAAA